MAGEVMVKGSKSAYNGRISLAGTQKVMAPKPNKGTGAGGTVRKGNDLRAGK